MKEIDTNIFVGSLVDYESIKNHPDFVFVQACKEPCHRKALGYKGKTVDKNHPEYLVAYRPERIILNMVDTDTGNYFSNILFEKSIDFISLNIQNHKKVLIHCNKGFSRSPSIGLLYLAINQKIRNKTFWDAKEDFLKIYPEYNPKGVQDFLSSNWSNYFG